MSNKMCTKCSIVKPFTDFSNHSKTKDGKQIWCRACGNDAVALVKRNYRRKAIEVYGDECVLCGATSADARLEFDHVNNDGKAHRSTEQIHVMYRRIAQMGNRISDYELQLLCVECHKGKTYGWAA